MSLPDPSTLPSLPESTIATVLDNLFEPCSTLRSFLIPCIANHNHAPIYTYTDLIEFCRSKLLQLSTLYKSSPGDDDLRLKICKIVSAHPRLGVPKRQQQELSQHSKAEQASLNSSPELAAKLIELNTKYENTFPGLIFVVFVNGRSREEIMDIMNYRIKNSNWYDEVDTAFNEMANIALDRARKLNAKL